MSDPMTRDFDCWLKEKRSILQERPIDEVAYLAHLCGFDWTTIFSVLSHWATDRTTHSKYSDREWYFVTRELDSLMPLKTQWERLRRHECGLDDREVA